MEKYYKVKQNLCQINIRNENIIFHYLNIFTLNKNNCIYSPTLFDYFFSSKNVTKLGFNIQFEGENING